MSKSQKKPARRRPATPPTRRRTRKPARPPADEILHALPIELPDVEPEPERPPDEADVVLASPEPAFASRALPPEPDRPLPSSRRAIFFDVENTSRAEHIARVIDHLAVDRMGKRTEFLAVGNWKVIGADTARLLARHGAQLVHSAPSTGVRDWSDLRIAVSAGVWLAGARPGDVLEVVSDDRAFDAVGDVAASIGIAFRRLSYRALLAARGEVTRTEAAAAPAPSHREHARTPAAAAPHATAASGRRRRGRRRPWRAAAAAAPAAAPAAPAAAPAPAPRVVAEPDGAPAGGEAHTAPHDEIVAVVRDLMHRAPGRGVTLDSLANALKSRGFRRPPGSPRLITRLRRIKELEVSANGLITLVGEADGAPPPSPVEPAPPLVEVEDVTPDDEAPGPGNKREPSAPAAAADADGARRRRSRRGGRGRRGRGRGQRAATTTA
ncbi:MAG: hypothetical protein HYR51_07215 [Candidatus Rokubacteria bacterium]|nr:hypothetical protein [Candidatus Rokubacteria bacterium]